MTLHRSASGHPALRIASAAFAVAIALLVGAVPAYAADDNGADGTATDSTLVTPLPATPAEGSASTPDDAGLPTPDDVASSAPGEDASPAPSETASPEPTDAGLPESDESASSEAAEPIYGVQLVTISAALEAGTVAPAGTGSVDDTILEVTLDNGTTPETVLCGIGPGIPTPGADEVLPVCPNAERPLSVPAGWTFRATPYRLPTGLAVREPSTQEVLPCIADVIAEDGVCSKSTNLLFVLGLPVVEAPAVSATPAPSAPAATKGPLLAATGGTDVGLALAAGLALCTLGGAIVVRRRLARG
ncbi:hypothetical protein ACF044_07325 [Microbacterium sp. NPDC016588]